MAMLIGKFHRLIQSRLLWIVFLVVIVFSFVIWGMQTPDRDQRQEAVSPGTLDGKPVPAEEFGAAYRHEYAGLVLMFGPELRINDEIDVYLRNAAWRRLIGWRAADRMGIRIDDAEILRAIREEPAFHDNGAFSLDRYRGMLGATLVRAGLSEPYFEEYLRGELRSRRLAAMFHLGTVVTPAELQSARAEQTERLAAEFLVLPADSDADALAVDEADARRVFERDPSVYRIPPRVRLRFVRFDAVRHLEAIGEFSEEAIEDYYEVNARSFQRLDFSLDGEGQPTAPRPVQPPLDDVRDEVIERLRQEAAIARARGDADRFVQSIAPYATARPLPFEEAATRARVEILDAEPVTRGERIPGIGAPLSATEAAFSLQPNPDDYFTEPFAGEDGVYVFALVERLPAYIPEFDAVRERAMADARAERREENRRAAAEAARQRLLAGEPMADVAADLGVDVQTAAPFPRASGPREPRARPLRAVLPGLNPGEVSDPVPMPDGSLLLARLTERRPATPEEMETAPETSLDLLRGQKSNAVFQAWLQGLLDRAGFEERARQDPEADFPDAEI